jgi:NhaP-type Na+/H+ or K+/H+ antiporter
VAQTVSSRLLERANWETLQFILENSVFLPIGLQVRSILDARDSSTLSTGRIAGACLAVLIVVIYCASSACSRRPTSRASYRASPAVIPRPTSTCR